VVSKGQSLLARTGGSNPSPSSGESSELRLGSGSRLPTQLSDHGGRAGDPGGRLATFDDAVPIVGRTRIKRSPRRQCDHRG
jgi:hypothetical protein